LIFLGQGLPLMQSQSDCLSQVAFNPIALEFKEAGSHLALKSLVENQATHHLGSRKLSLNAPKVVVANG
jgi:hypothetical protein